YEQVEGPGKSPQQGKADMVKITGTVKSHSRPLVRQGGGQFGQLLLEAPKPAKAAPEANARSPLPRPDCRGPVPGQQVALPVEAAVKVQDLNVHGESPLSPPKGVGSRTQLVSMGQALGCSSP